MRSTRILQQVALLAVCAALVMVLGGCPKHENFPAALDVTVPPTPANFSITVVPNTTDYTFEWEISDASTVKNYRLYVIGLSLAPELVDEPTGTQVQTSFAYSVKGLQFGVSAVSTDNVEGAMTVKKAP